MEVVKDFLNLQQLILYILIAVLLFLKIDKKRLVTPKNISLGGIIIFYSLIGIIIFPFSYSIDKFPVENLRLFFLSKEMTVHLILITLCILLSTLLLLDKNGISRALEKWLSKYVQKNYFSNIKISYLLLLLFSGLSITFILYTFYKTNNVPYITALKYFENNTIFYIPLRPFYVLSLHILSIINLILILNLFSHKRKDYVQLLKLITLLVINSFFLLLTMKRGELFFPYIMLLGGIILKGKYKKLDFLKIILLIITFIVMASLLHPGKKCRPFCYIVYKVLPVLPEQDKICQKIVSTQKTSLLKKQDLYKNTESFFKKVENVFRYTKITFSDIFGAHIRESSRLIYNFYLKSYPFIYGKTYLASILGFIPTKYFRFKEKYQLGRLNAKLTGQNPEVAGGARVGGWTEAYINFGFIGVVIYGLLLAVLIFLIDKIWFLNREDNLVYLVLVFFLLSHLVFGLFVDGSPALQTFIIRAIILFFLIILPKIIRVKINTR